MKHTFTLVTALLLAPLAELKAEPLPSSFGVWDRGETKDPKEYSFLKGTSCDAPWDSVEKQPGVYDWSAMDQAIETVYKNKTSLYFSFEAGPQTPNWVYEKGVPRVVTDDTKHKGKFPCYPYYLSPEYKTCYTRFITEVAKHIRSYPKDRQERIAFIQIKTGCTGDETPYKGKARDRKYDLPKSSPEWRGFRLETFALYAKLFDQGPDPKISLLFASITGDDEDGEGKNPEEWKWVTSHITGGFGTKAGALSRGHHLSGERTTVNTWQRYLVDPKEPRVFARSEMDQTWTRPWYQLNVPLNFYWGAVNALNSGQSVWDVTKSAIEASKEQGFDYSFNFFNRYAGQIYPASATDAFCALHKGLDAADTKAYPEAKFGKASHGNVDRMLKICAEYAKYGARVDDKAALTMGQVQQRGDQTGFNDVGWDIWPDNYSRLLAQIDADATSIPLWRVGGPITPTSSIYSRFARGFAHASGKDAMYFKLHDGFSQDARPKAMSITVVWYDGQEGSTWKLDYDAGTPTMKTAMSVIGKGDKQWHHEVVTLPDAVLRHDGIKGADLALVNTDAKDDIFSLIEVHRGEQELPALRPPTNVRAFPGYAKGTKYGKGGNRDKAKKGERKNKAGAEKK
ncbi:MAG: T9SS C-terminal target domain-containing protein [Planctomycetota bacterium]|nr:T9SS C-terminal target domain-containing protein [Planctomycetota bacterium]